jgi:hypothetical protein
MIKPVRLQLSRAKGFSLQALSLATNGLPVRSVARPGPWGNPFIVGAASGVFAEGMGHQGKAEILIPALTLDQCIEFYEQLVDGIISPEMHPHGHDWMRRIKRAYSQGHPTEHARAMFRGRNLACWCSPPAPGKHDRCHAAVLIKIVAEGSGE